MCAKRMDERQFLDKAADTYRTFTSPVSKWSIDSYIRIYKQNMDVNIPGGRALELGCSNGYSTDILSDLVKALDVVDGSKRMLEKLDAKLLQKKNIKFIYSLFEELNFENRYDYVFGSYVLEHVIDPLQVLRIAYQALKPGGKLFITVPNANALSRQMALEMNIIKDLYELTENDIAHGHRRVFDLSKLEVLIRKSPFKMIEIGGTFVKEFADFQLNQMIEKGIIGEEQLFGMQKLAERYPELSGSIYAVCQK